MKSFELIKGIEKQVYNSLKDYLIKENEGGTDLFFVEYNSN